MTTADQIAGNARMTGDRAVISFYHAEKISDNQALTPEGYLVCYGVPIARTGTMSYHKSEVPVIAGDSEMVTIERREEHVFAASAIASFLGKPVTDNHPSEGVNSGNWKQHAVGIVQNVRRGDGTYANHLVADILITDKKAITAVRNGKKEVSCGYDADFIAISPGRGMQQNIIGNHVALVDRGRCGASCSIKDKDYQMEITDVKEAVKAVFADMFAPKTQVSDCAGDKIGKMADQLKAITDRMEARDQAAEAAKVTAKAKDDAEAAEKKKKDDNDKDEADKKAKNKSKDSYSAILANAEIMSPGIQLAKPVNDAEFTIDEANALKIKALDAALKTDNGIKHIQPLLTGRTLDSLSHDALDLLFASGTAFIKNANNTKTTASRDSAGHADVYQLGGLQKVADAFWNKK